MNKQFALLTKLDMLIIVFVSMIVGILVDHFMVR